MIPAMKKLLFVAVVGFALAGCREKPAGSDVEAKAEEKAAEMVEKGLAPEAPAAEADAAMGEAAAEDEAAKDGETAGGPEEAEPVGDH